MFLPSFRLDGKTALVTGAGRGIGRAIAIGFAEARTDAALIARTEADLQETASHIEQFGQKAYIYPLDVIDRKAVHDAVANVKQQAGSLDIIVNNAVMNIRTPALDVTDHEWETIMNTNLKSAFLVSQEAASTMSPLSLRHDYTIRSRPPVSVSSSWLKTKKEAAVCAASLVYADGDLCFFPFKKNAIINASTVKPVATKKASLIPSTVDRCCTSPYSS